MPSPVRDGVPAGRSYGSENPMERSWLRRNMLAATIEKVVRTSPVPQAKTTALSKGDVDERTRKNASRALSSTPRSRAMGTLTRRQLQKESDEALSHR
jgi:hypothetical protein